MADSTRTHFQVRRFRWLAALGLSLALLAIAGAWSPAPARADGDPASDVLASQPLFLAQDAGLSLRQQTQLAALLSAARRSGYPLRVAVIASRTDLGSVTELWRRPQNYARFLGQELSLVYRGTLLVVMPNGFGLYRPGARVGGQRAALAGLSSPGAASGMGPTTIAAVRRLSAAAGHPLRVGAISTRAAPGQTDYGALIALAAGALLIALAWVLSLRARPLSSRSEPAP